LPFVKQKDIFKETTDELVQQVGLNMLTEEKAMLSTADLRNCFEVISWYMFFISAKLQRALRGKLEDRDDDETDNSYPKDSDGSAKVALVAIERSMGAWMSLYRLMPSSEDTALNALSLLGRMKDRAIENFPLAMQFKRPGFDGE
jgi:hypothetical protein